MKEITTVKELPEDFALDYSGSDSWDDLISLCPELEDCSYAYVLAQDGDYVAIYGHYGNNLTPYLENDLELLYPSPKYDNWIKTQNSTTKQLFKDYGKMIFNSYFLDIPCKRYFDGGIIFDVKHSMSTQLTYLIVAKTIMIASLSETNARFELKVK